MIAAFHRNDPFALQRPFELARLDGKFAAHPALTLVHILFGGVFLLLAPLQFSTSFRTRHIRIHRWIGRVLLPAVLIGVLPGLYFGVLIPYGGPGEAVAIALFGGLLVLSVWRGYAAIRRHQVARHREWMIRTFAIAISISSVRIIGGVFDMTLTPAGIHSPDIFGLSIWTGWVMTLGAAEFWIRYTRTCRIQLQSSVRVAASLLACCSTLLACTAPARGNAAALSAQSGADPDITAFIEKIRAVDNHSHANSVVPADSDYDALPLDGVPFVLPVPLRPESPDWLAADKALYQYPQADLSGAHLTQLRALMQGIAKAQGEKFPTWVLDQVGDEVLLANRVAMGPGLTPPRFRWVSYVDALMLPLSTKDEGLTSPDREKLFPLEEKLLRRYLTDLRITRRPATLDAYLKTVVTPTLEAQQKGGCVAVKFEAAYLRALDFDEVTVGVAGSIYAKYANGGEPSHADYKALQDFLFRYIAREAGRLGMAVHIHSFEGFGNFYQVAGADPLRLEPAFNDPALRKTNFVILHGGGVNARHAGAMIWKPNVYLDMSMMTLAYTPARLADVLRDWLTQNPEKVLFGSDAFAFGPDMGWELTAWVAGRNGRAALALALTDMIGAGEVSRARAKEIATMVLRTNAGKLYKLGLK
jgi:predicted TIM-barrel fold metal-dependent hydrolase/uncharacterized membrane protein